ncbi:MAG: bis(5'-nucleosyl)-tetraphosphatase (symmetrical) YqeK [Tissierellia bacterium]|nr:bis(5'-nucleosyl)-tetraphosphatase (symmetrical) YqeK [Tissierellia bacterium]
MELEKIRQKIEARIGKKRMEHTYRVMETAEKLATIYNVDVEKVKTAAFLHDCAKMKDRKDLIRAANHYDMLLTKEMKKAPQIIHAYLGALIAEREYHIKDEDILNGIQYHTTGRENMSDLEKIIFLADYMEPKRNFPGVEKARELAEKDLNEAMLYALTQTIHHLLDSNEVIALDTIKARNYLLEK